MYIVVCLWNWLQFFQFFFITLSPSITLFRFILCPESSPVFLPQRLFRRHTEDLAIGREALRDDSNDGWVEPILNDTSIRETTKRHYEEENAENINDTSTITANMCGPSSGWNMQISSSRDSPPSLFRSALSNLLLSRFLCCSVKAVKIGNLIISK